MYRGNNYGINIGLLIFRLSIGGLLLIHGISKIFNGIEPIKMMVSNAGMPEWFAFGVFIGEVVAPIFLIFGVASRLFALIIAINMLFAFGTVHMNDFLTLNQNGGWGIELLALYFFGAVGLIFTGGGKLSFSKRFFWD